ncbi:hypothetical protein PsorP6_014257 [Peronosclerospora sorghi]|uniref:Uncharacterized protein n=1 Tax=Peronosclerospora sorghi TaxID=230839 RepID=A0ACC0VK45_9STRA|nr:hypothetical protein PsorP6_014257 [Peronosclerospora sorghi]
MTLQQQNADLSDFRARTVRAEKSEATVEKLQNERQQQQAVIAVLKEEHKAMIAHCSDLKIDQEQLQILLRVMEESVAQQVRAAEARVHEE